MTVNVAARPLPERATIVVLRALPGLGDWLCAVPTMRALRAARPDARIHLVALEPTRSLVARFAGYVDAFHAFPGWPGLPERRPAVREIPRFLGEIQGLEADLAIQLHGAGEITNGVAELFGAQHVAGFYRSGERCPDVSRFLRWHDADPEIRRGLRLLGLLDLPVGDEHLEFPLDPTARTAARDLLEQAGVDGSYVLLHPGANRPAARWSQAGFADVGASLVDQGRRVVLTGSPAERTLTAAVARSVPGAIDLGGRTDLDTLAWLVAGARLLISNDSGVSHLAAALRVPSVVVFLDPVTERWRRWAPLDSRRHRPVPGSVRGVIAEADRLLRRQERAA